MMKRQTLQWTPPATLNERRTAAALTAPCTPRSVVALTRYERETFFPGDLGEALDALLPDAERIDPADISATEWQSTLCQERTELLVACWSTPPIPAEAVALRYVCNVTGSVRKLVPRTLVARGLQVTNWGNVAAATVAEHALLLILGLLRSLPAWSAAVAQPWSQQNRDRLNAKSLFGRRVALHGFGHVARELLKLLRPFGVDVMVYSVGVPSEYLRQHAVKEAKSLVELAEWGDVFVTCEALTVDTTGSVDRCVLSALREESVFINVGRGAVVDEPALAEIALSKNLRVGCDVFEVEPLPRSSGLLNVATALYTPHSAGPTPDAYPKCGALALQNLRRFLNDEPLEHVITLDVYDRST